MDDENHPKLDDSLHHPKVDDENHPKLDDENHPKVDDENHPKVNDKNHPKLDDYCSILFCIETRERNIINKNWMIIAYHEKIIQIWMITDGQKSSIFGTRPYLPF